MHTAAQPLNDSQLLILIINRISNSNSSYRRTYCTQYSRYSHSSRYTQLLHTYVHSYTACMYTCTLLSQQYARTHYFLLLIAINSIMHVQLVWLQRIYKLYIIAKLATHILLTYKYTSMRSYFVQFSIHLDAIYNLGSTDTISIWTTTPGSFSSSIQPMHIYIFYKLVLANTTALLRI